MLVALLVTALSVARERELGTFDQLLVSPGRPRKFSRRKGDSRHHHQHSEGSIIIFVGTFIFGIPFTGSLGLFMTLMSVRLGDRRGRSFYFIPLTDATTSSLVPFSS